MQNPENGMCLQQKLDAKYTRAENNNTHWKVPDPTPSTDNVKCNSDKIH